jgi:hypothetical protein
MDSLRTSRSYYVYFARRALMETKGKEETVPEAFLTTDPKLILRKPRPFNERHTTLLKILAGVAGGLLALLLVTRFLKLF